MRLGSALAQRDTSILLFPYPQILFWPQTVLNSILNTRVVTSSQTSKAPLTFKTFLAESSGHQAFEDVDRILLTQLLSLEMLETENRSEYQVFIKNDGKACTLNTDDKPISQSAVKTWSKEGDVSIEGKRVKEQSDQKVCVRDRKRGLNIKGIYCVYGSHMSAYHHL